MLRSLGLSKLVRGSTLRAFSAPRTTGLTRGDRSVATHIMRKYRRWIIVFGVSFTAIPLVFFVPGGFGSRNNNDPYAAFGESVAKVGNIPITAGDFMEQYNAFVQSLPPGTERPTAQELVADGIVESLLDVLVEDALIRMDTQDASVRPNQEYLTERIKDDPFFQREDGTFDAGFYNQWIKNSDRAKRNWNELYDSIAQSVNRKVHTNVTVASARVLDAELREDFERRSTKIKVRFVAVDPKKEYTDEELQESYDRSPGIYQTDPERTAQFVRFPLTEDPAENEATLERAQRFAETAKAGTDLSVVAETEGLELLRSSSFTFISPEIDNVASDDTIAFRGQLSGLDMGEISEVVHGRRNYIVAQIVDFVEARQMTFEEAREDIVRNADLAYKQTPEFEERAHAYMDKMEGDARPLGEIIADYPELELTVEESPLFAFSDTLFTSGIFWDSRDAHDVLSRRDVGAKASLKDFRATHYVLELVEREKPEEGFWEKEWPEQRETLRETALASARNERHQDYLRFLQKSADDQSLIQRNYPAIWALLGLEDGPAPSPSIDAISQGKPPVESETEITDPTVVTLDAPETPAE